MLSDRVPDRLLFAPVMQLKVCVGLFLGRCQASVAEGTHRNSIMSIAHLTSVSHQR